MPTILFVFFPSQEIVHFLSVASCDSLPLTRLEGLKDLSRQLRTNKTHVTELLQECHGTDADLSIQGCLCVCVCVCVCVFVCVQVK